MKRTIFLLLTLAGLTLSALAEQGKRPLTATEVKAVIKAVEDEIYDRGNHKDFYQLGDNLGTSQHWKSRMHIYINPQYDIRENVGEIIYKFMPYGEILRVFFIGKGGQI